jgi:hypothetical protein
VVDTPGLFDRHDDPKHDAKMQKEILKSVALSLPGPHVFFLLFRADDRFTELDSRVVKKVEELFSAELMRYVIVVFTHSPEEGELSLKELLKEERGEEQKTEENQEEKKEWVLTSLFKSVNDRVVGIENNYGTESQRKVQLQKLLRMAIDLRDENAVAGKDFYTNALVSHCLQLLQSAEFNDTSLEDIKKEIQKEKDGGRPMAKLTTDPQARGRAQQVRQAAAAKDDSWCTIL